MLLAQYICKELKTEYPGKAPYALALISNYWCSGTVPTHISLIRNFYCTTSKGKLYEIFCGFLSLSLARPTKICTTISHTYTYTKKTRDQLNQVRKAQKLAIAIVSLHTAAYLC